MVGNDKDSVMVSQFIVELQGLKTAEGEDPPRILHFNLRLEGEWSGKPVIELNTCYRMQWGSVLRCEGWMSPADEETGDSSYYASGTTRDTWVTVLCRKLRDWWHWVADGELPIVASHGVEVEVYKTLDPGLRVVILKALCDIHVEQEDIRNYIDNSHKHGVQLSAFRKERTGGDSHGIFYWYEDDPIIGHRLYWEIRKAEVKKAKTKGSQVLPNALYHQWETMATNLDEFQDVSQCAGAQ